MDGRWDQRKSPESKPRAVSPACSSLTKMHRPHVHPSFPCSPRRGDVIRLQVAIPSDQWAQKANLVPKACFVHPTLYWGKKKTELRNTLLKVKGLAYTSRFHLAYGILGFAGASDGKESACNAGDLGSILVPPPGIEPRHWQ